MHPRIKGEVVLKPSVLYMMVMTYTSICLAATFDFYLQGVRRATILLKGLRPENVYAGGKLSAGGPKPNAEFLAPWLHFVLPQADPTNTLYGACLDPIKVSAPA